MIAAGSWNQLYSLGIHSTGFLGKFYAEDIENTDPKAQEALEAVGANKLKLFRFAILLQVMSQCIAYTLYVLDRNVRMATVIGLVGAGGIGQELKGRYDLFNYGHVGTILVAIFFWCWYWINSRPGCGGPICNRDGGSRSIVRGAAARGQSRRRSSHSLVSRRFAIHQVSLCAR